MQGGRGEAPAALLLWWIISAANCRCLGQIEAIEAFMRLFYKAKRAMSKDAVD